MNYAVKIVTLVVLFVWCASSASAQSDGKRVQYEPTWESLDKHSTPEWLMDAKLGLFIYGPGFTKEEWEHHNAQYGGQPGVARHVGAKYPDHWVGRAWDKLPWEPDDLAQLAADAGARYVVFGRTSFILCHPSKHNDVEGSMFTRMGPKDRDYVGEIAAAVRARKLRFGLYTNYMTPTLVPNWIETMKEAIDRYQPSTLWFDGDKMRYSADELRSRELLAYYYNHSKKQDEVAAEDAMGSYKGPTWGKRLHHGDWYRKEESPPHDDISDGYYVRYRELFYGLSSAPSGEAEGLSNNIIEWLVDCTAKNGNLEPAIFIGPPSHFALARRCLRGLGDWLKVNGEGIYGTRPWYDGKPQDLTASGIHVRYTTKGDSLYAILFKWRPSGPTFPHLRAAEGTTVQLLGVPAPSLKWEQTDKGLVVHPAPQNMDTGKAPNVPCDHAFVYKITPRPEWVD